MKGRTLVQLSSGSPRLARTAHEWARSLGVSYLDGAILGYPSSIGEADTAILIAGDAGASEAAEPVLSVLAPASTYLGEDAGLASILDEALLSGALGAIIGVVNGAALCEAGGLPLAQYCEWVAGLTPTLVGMVTETAQRIADDNLAETEASLATWGATLDYMSKSAADAGFSNEIPAFIRTRFDRALEKGLGEHDVAALIEVVRPNKA